MDTRRLRSFVKIVDTGSLTRAAAILHIAQPALSQQVAALEAQFGQRLLIRSKRGVAPTEAGRALYRHAQLILRQVAQAQSDVSQSGSQLSGLVSIGLAPYSTGGELALPLLRLVRARYPRIVLHINENFGGVISEMVMTGRMDMAVIYEPGAIRGVTFKPLFEEALVLAVPASFAIAGTGQATVPLTALASVPLMLPSRIHTIRQVVEQAFARARIEPTLTAEIESVATLGSALATGLGATILPWSAARRVAGEADVALRRIVRPEIRVKVSLCTADQLAISDAALAVRDLVFELVDALPADGNEGRARLHVRPGPDAQGA
jgi:LysR family nitrogen assimilation transcriptional regulator